ncbi:MAG: hypothetical protein ACREGB_01485 [Candidatus Saccharimonadales bacterium]
MPEVLGKIQPTEVYNHHLSDRLREEDISINGIYGVMLKIQHDEAFSLMLPALVTGKGPDIGEQLVFMTMQNREREPRPIHVGVLDGTFVQFDNSILVPQGAPGPEVTEGYLLEHPEVTRIASAIRQALSPTTAADTVDY